MALKTEELTDNYEVVCKTLCRSKLGDNSLMGLERNCNKCGVHLLQEILKPFVSEKMITWREWSKKDGRQCLVVHEDPTEDFVSSLLVSLEPFAMHLFNAEWQYKQYNYNRKNPGEGTLVLGMDFAENFLTKNQDEISQVQFGHYRQITTSYHLSLHLPK